jgi:hypothetical protein
MRGGIIEVMAQVSDVFNRSGNPIRLDTISRRGNYHQESFLANTASLVSRRDTTVVTDATAIALTMAEIISVKLNRKVGPVEQTLDSFRKVQMSAGDEALSFLIGTQIAKAMQVDMINSACRAAAAALLKSTNTKYDGSAGTATASGLSYALQKMGDAQGNIVAWVMHSKVYFDLMRHQMTPANNGEQAASATVYSATPATLGRPVIVIDSDDLKLDDSPDLYYTLGLTSNGVVVENSEEEIMHQEIVSGKENLISRLQGEFAYNLGVKGFKWVTGSGANPTDAAVRTGSNWTQVAASVKDAAGAVLVTR